MPECPRLSRPALAVMVSRALPFGPIAQAASPRCRASSPYAIATTSAGAPASPRTCADIRGRTVIRHCHLFFL
jgi:hypothetical protein